MKLSLLAAGPAALLLLAPVVAVQAQSPKPLPSTSLDYSRLYNTTYSYADLRAAKADKLTDTQIATILKIAEESHSQFREVADAVYRGETIPNVAARYNINTNKLANVTKQEDEISAYEAAYLVTGKQGMRHTPYKTPPVMIKTDATP